MSRAQLRNGATYRNLKYLHGAPVTLTWQFISWIILFWPRVPRDTHILTFISFIVALNSATKVLVISTIGLQWGLYEWIKRSRPMCIGVVGIILVTKAYGYKNVYARSTEYSSYLGSSLYLWSSSSSPTGRSWQLFVVRRRSLLALRAHPMSQSLDPVKIQSRRQTREMKWLRKERWWVVRATLPESGISRGQRLWPRRKSTLWEPWSTSQFASPSAGCRCILSSRLQKYR